MSMKKLILALGMSVLASMSLLGPAQAAAGGIPWDKFPTERTTDMAALQNGAKVFANYCLSCHAAGFMRYNRLRDIGLTEQQIAENLVFTGAKVGDTMGIAMDPKDAKAWFGKVPPDLTLVARSRSAAGKGSGSDYLYTYFRTYYRDDTTLTGWNNMAFPNVGMPHVLWQLQGTRTPVYETKTEHGQEVQVFKGWQQVTPGTMTPVEYDTAIADLVNYLQWMAEPAQNTRKRVGVWVLLFLGVLTFVTWRLNAAYWKDIK